jgi:hypothetical protein
MHNRDYLRMQAAALLRLSGSCFDLDTARRLRQMAHDMQRQAADDEGDIPPAYMQQGNGHSGDMDRD